MRHSFKFYYIIMTIVFAAVGFNAWGYDRYESQPLGGNHTTTSVLSENPDVEAQLKGEYGSLKREQSMPLGAIQHVWDKAHEGAGVRSVDFNPRDTLRVITREFMSTTIVFPAFERISKIENGDASVINATTPKPNMIVLRPQDFVGVDTSITAIGDSGHVYPIYVRVEGYNSNNMPDLKVNVRVPAPKYAVAENAKILNDQDGALSKYKEAVTQKGDYLEAVTFDPSQLDFNFTMAGNKEIAPNRIYSDGIRTWFDYGNRIKKGDLPAIYAVVDGVDTPINVYREGTKLVAQASGTFSLRNGERLTCAYPTVQGDQNEEPVKHKKARV
jgi:ComB9 competence protein